MDYRLQRKTREIHLQTFKSTIRTTETFSIL